MSKSAAESSSNVIRLPARLRTAEQSLLPQAALARLADVIREGDILYVVLRHFSADSEWLVCDLYRIQGHDVRCLTADVARALDRYDPDREIGMKIVRIPGRDMLRDLIDGTLSRLLFGAAEAVRHQVIR